MTSHLVPMRRMGTQSRMRRIQFDLCASQVNNCLRRRPEWVPMRRMGTRNVTRNVCVLCKGFEGIIETRIYFFNSFTKLYEIMNAREGN